MGVLAPIDEPIDGFMAERDRVVHLEIRANLFWAQILLEQRHHEHLGPSREFAVFPGLRPALPLAVEILRPVVGVQMGAGPHIPSLLSTDRGGVASQGVGNLHIAFAVAHRLVLDPSTYGVRSYNLTPALVQCLHGPTVEAK